MDPDFEALLPTTYPNTTHHRCKQDNGLCCYQTPARRNRYQTYFEAFTLIEGRGHIWRLHFVINRFTLDLTSQLSNVVQFCNPQDMENCEGETPLDTPLKLPDDDNGVNFMERFEECVYDDGESEHEWKNRLCEVGLEPGTSSPK